MVFYSFVRVRFKSKRSKLSNSTWRNFCCIHVAHDYFPSVSFLMRGAIWSYQQKSMVGLNNRGIRG